MAATEMQHFTLAQRLTAEGVGTALLLAAVVGSGIMGERLAGGMSPWRCWPTPLRPEPPSWP